MLKWVIKKCVEKSKTNDNVVQIETKEEDEEREENTKLLNELRFWTEGDLIISLAPLEDLLYAIERMDVHEQKKLSRYTIDKLKCYVSKHSDEKIIETDVYEYELYFYESLFIDMFKEVLTPDKLLLSIDDKRFNKYVICAFFNNLEPYLYRGYDDINGQAILELYNCHGPTSLNRSSFVEKYNEFNFSFALETIEKYTDKQVFDYFKKIQFIYKGNNAFKSEYRTFINLSHFHRDKTVKRKIAERIRVFEQENFSQSIRNILVNIKPLGCGDPISDTFMNIQDNVSGELNKQAVYEEFYDHLMNN